MRAVGCRGRIVLEVRAAIRPREAVRSLTTRRGALLVKAEVIEIARGVIWTPCHFPERSTNFLTNDALDPVCGITELKACAAKIEALGPGSGAADGFTRNETTRMEEVRR